LFREGSLKEAKRYKAILYLHYKATSMEANANKSSLLINGLNEELER
jgi:hypothetical protein